MARLCRYTRAVRWLLLFLALSACATTQQAQSPAAARVSSHPLAFRPYTLWELVARADDIAFADVGPTVEVTHWLEANWNETRLAPRETWKGAPLVSVGRHPYATCGHVATAPKAGERAVIFSTRGDGQDHLLEVRRPSGPEALGELRQMVAFALELQARGVLRSRAWMRTAMVARATRWDGLAELQLSGGVLTSSEREALIAAYVASPSVDAAIPDVLSMLQEHRTEELDQAVASGLELVVRARNPGSHLRAARHIEALVRTRGCQVDASPSAPTSSSPEKMVQLVGDGSGTPGSSRADVEKYWERVKRACGLAPRPVAGVGEWNEVRYAICPE